jgi:hypothetical protein
VSGGESWVMSRSQRDTEVIAWLQLRALTLAAAQDVDAFYAQRERTAPGGKDLLVGVSVRSRLH